MAAKLAPINTSCFTYDKATKTFTAESSDFGHNLPLGRVYDDACDVGFTLVSSKTGNEIVFVLDNIETDEGEVTAWVFKPAEKSYSIDGWSKFTVRIYND